MSEEPSYYAKDRATWRRWLRRNHAKATVVHLIFYRKATGKPCPSYDDAVEEGLCFGWIDGLKHKLDDERYTCRFTPRKPNSNWSPSNKARIAKLEAAGLLEPAGLAAIAEAKRSGQWDAPERADANVIPAELAAALRKSKPARAVYDAMPPGHRREWNAYVGEAKRPETRERRAARAIETLRAGPKRPLA
jgi:uncharacterized protein YdeI (YjbR/CyaY-like superfamily)